MAILVILIKKKIPISVIPVTNWPIRKHFLPSVTGLVMTQGSFDAASSPCSTAPPPTFPLSILIKASSLQRMGLFL